jgi:hypothetical protein
MSEDLLGQLAKRQDLSTTQARLVRDPLREHPSLGRALQGAAETSWVADAIESLRREIPLPPSCKAFTGAFFRPPAHNRCFYLRPRNSGGVLAFKGLEPLAPGHEQVLRNLQRTPTTGILTNQKRWAEHFALREFKVPGTMTLREAEEEATIAAAYQVRHLEAYDELAHIPLPLAVHSHGKEVHARVLAGLRPLLSRPAYERVVASSGTGLGAYVYYYPAVCTRVSELNRELPDGGFDERLARLSAQLDPAVIIDRWVRNITRMFYLGYLPASYANYGTGQLCGAQNAVIDGGFVDADSLTPIQDLIDDVYFFDSLHFAIGRSFAQTVQTLLVKAVERNDMVDMTNKLTVDYLTTRFRAAFETEARPGLALDSRIVEYFSPTSSIAELTARLRRALPPGEEITILGPWPMGKPKG